MFTSPPTRTQSTLGSSGSRAPLRAWVIGDSGAVTPLQAAVTKAALGLMAREGLPAHVMVANGDIAYMHGTDEQFQVR